MRESMGDRGKSAIAGLIIVGIVSVGICLLKRDSKVGNIVQNNVSNEMTVDTEEDTTLMGYVLSGEDLEATGWTKSVNSNNQVSFQTLVKTEEGLSGLVITPEEYDLDRYIVDEETLETVGWKKVSNNDHRVQFENANTTYKLDVQPVYHDLNTLTK